jgi:hypothetical protein
MRTSSLAEQPKIRATQSHDVPSPATTAREAQQQAPIVAASRPFDPSSVSRRALPPTHAGYEAQSARDKQDALYAEAVRELYAELPNPNTGGLGAGKNALEKIRSFMRVFDFVTLHESFDTTADMRNFQKDKLFHPFGAIAKVELEIDPSSPYSGLLRTGGPGMVRLSLATDAQAGFAPGFGLKLFVDGEPSKNIVTGNQLGGLELRDFFAHEVATSLPKPKSLALRFASWVLSFVADPLIRPVDHLASVDARGQQQADARAPKKLVFVPNPALRDVAAGEQYREGLATIAAGTLLYSVVAEEHDGTRRAIGALRTSSPIVATPFGDKRLFFKHER